MTNTSEWKSTCHACFNVFNKCTEASDFISDMFAGPTTNCAACEQKVALHRTRAPSSSINENVSVTSNGQAQSHGASQSLSSQWIVTDIWKINYTNLTRSCTVKIQGLLVIEKFRLFIMKITAKTIGSRRQNRIWIFIHSTQYIATVFPFHCTATKDIARTDKYYHHKNPERYQYRSQMLH